MRRLLPLALAFTVLLAGCGGGGTGSPDRTGNVAGQLPTVTTTYTGNLIDPRGNVAGPITLVVQPNGAYTFTTTYGDGFAASGSLTPSGADGVYVEYFSLTSNGNGEWYGQGVQTGITYTGGGNITFGSNNISGAIQFTSSTISYTGMTFSANPT